MITVSFDIIDDFLTPMIDYDANNDDNDEKRLSFSFSKAR